VLKFLDEIQAFSPEFRAQLEKEGKFAEQEIESPGKIKIKNHIMDFTPYVKIAADDRGKHFSVCSRCEHVYAEAAQDYKLYALIYERDPGEIYPGYLAPDKDWAVYREFYCPGCGTQIEAEQCPPCMTIIPEVRIKGVNIK